MSETREFSSAFTLLARQEACCEARFEICFEIRFDIRLWGVPK
jgi:hypothetical protein